MESESESSINQSKNQSMSMPMHCSPGQDKFVKRKVIPDGTSCAGDLQLEHVILSSMCSGSGCTEIVGHELAKAWAKTFGKRLRCTTPFMCEAIPSKQAHLKRIVEQLKSESEDGCENETCLFDDIVSFGKGQGRCLNLDLDIDIDTL